MNIMTVDAAEALSRKAHDRFESLRAHSRTRSTTSDKWSRTDLNGSTLMATIVARGAPVSKASIPGVGVAAPRSALASWHEQTLITGLQPSRAALAAAPDLPRPTEQR